MIGLVLASANMLAAAIASAVAQTPLERGNYLVNAVMACDGCHTPRGPAGFIMERRFTGGSQTWDTPRYLVKGSNISPDSETGIGKWSADDFKRALTEGVRPSDALQVQSVCANYTRCYAPLNEDPEARRFNAV